MSINTTIKLSFCGSLSNSPTKILALAIAFPSLSLPDPEERETRQSKINLCEEYEYQLMF